VPSSRGRWSILLVLVLAVAPGAAAGPFGDRLRERAEQSRRAADPVVAIQSGPRTREFVLHLPPAHGQTEQTLPLVLFFHGGKSRAERMDGLTGFNELADQRAFVVAYPKGVDHRWNDGRGSALATADDVEFVHDLIDHLVSRYRIDPRKVYATGISNGGMVLHLLACRLHGQIAAIASVAGTLPANVARSCARDARMAVLMIHGTKDPLVLWRGGTGGKPGQIRGETLSVAESIAFWASRDGCDARPRATTRVGSGDAGTVTWRLEYCRDVVLYKVVDGGHTWPGGPQYAPEALIGKTSRDFSATRTIWEFFASH
jgi:polyhydroxybutyrate depolymerase